MKNNLFESEKDVQNSSGHLQLSGIAEISAVAKMGRHMRKIFYITSLAGLGFCLNACTSTGYVETEPAYVEYTRPPQPSSNHIWINGDWQYNRQNRVYVQKNGYWEKPSRNRSYMQGHWESSPQGRYWVSGHYQKNHR